MDSMKSFVLNIIKKHANWVAVGVSIPTLLCAIIVLGLFDALFSAGSTSLLGVLLVRGMIFLVLTIIFMIILVLALKELRKQKKMRIIANEKGLFYCPVCENMVEKSMVGEKFQGAYFCVDCLRDMVAKRIKAQNGNAHTIRGMIGAFAGMAVNMFFNYILVRESSYLVGGRALVALVFLIAALPGFFFAKLAYNRMNFKDFLILSGSIVVCYFGAFLAGYVSFWSAELECDASTVLVNLITLINYSSEITRYFVLELIFNFIVPTVLSIYMSFRCMSNAKIYE